MKRMDALMTVLNFMLYDPDLFGSQHDAIWDELFSLLADEFARQLPPLVVER